MEKNSSKKGDIKISLLGLLIGISLIVAGVYGISYSVQNTIQRFPLLLTEQLTKEGLILFSVRTS